MYSSSTAVNTLNKSKEDFIWFVKKATTDKKSYSHSELYHSLLKMFVDADTNKVSVAGLHVNCKPLHFVSKGRPGQQSFLLQPD